MSLFIDMDKETLNKEALFGVSAIKPAITNIINKGVNTVATHAPSVIPHVVDFAHGVAMQGGQLGIDEVAKAGVQLGVPAVKKTVQVGKQVGTAVAESNKVFHENLSSLDPYKAAEIPALGPKSKAMQKNQLNAAFQHQYNNTNIFTRPFTPKLAEDLVELIKEAALKKGINLYNYQQRAVDKIVNHGDDNADEPNNLILAHAVGSGKTLSSIAAFEKMKEKGHAKRALVVTPASLRENFAQQGIKQYTNSKYSIIGNLQEASAKNATYRSIHNLDPNADYHIISYEMFKKNPEEYVKRTGADTVIFDELHRSKDDMTKVYDSIQRSRRYYKNFIGLTGSIVSNRPHDVVPLINAMTEGRNNIGSVDDFEKNHVIRKQIPGLSPRKWPIIGLKNVTHLKDELNKYIDYVDEEDVGADKKPRKEVKVIPVEMTKEQKKIYKAVLAKNPVMAKKLKHIDELSDDEVKKLYNALIGARRVGNSYASFKHISLEDAAEVTPKVHTMLNDLEEHLNSTPDGHAIIYSNLIDGGVDVIEAGLRNRNIPYGKFIGKGNEGVTEKTRQQDVNDYNASKKRVMLISAAGGEGLNLKNTTMVLSADPHFNPEKINQVEARGVRTGGLAHRDPEDRVVHVNRYIATLPEEGLIFKKREPSIDQRIYEVAARKARTNQMLLNLLKAQEEEAQQ